MKYTCIRYLLLCIIALQAFSGYAQPTAGGSSGVGIIRATLKDSVTGEPLPLATVMAYRSADSLFLSALFSSNNGSFTLRNLPTDTTLTIIISYVGYGRQLKKVKLTATQPELLWGNILLSGNAETNNVVVVAEIPPLRMKGDTLEINPAAFNAGPNAVVEDMLKKVPGVVLWADGKITVNGKEVVKLLVDGKPFFTGDIKVATQNLPPDAIHKVQVYSEDKDQPDDKTMNLVLKADKKKGQFGKVSAAGGTAHRYEADASWNRYKPGQQLSIGLAANNTNKTASDLGSLLRFSTYRGNISDPGYQSNFWQDGTNTSYAGGINLNQDLAKDRPLQSEYFGKYQDEKLARLQTDVTLVGDSSFLGESISNSRRRTWQHYLNSNYKFAEKQGQKTALRLAAFASGQTYQNSNRAATTTSGGSLLNRSNQNEDGRNQQQQVEVTTNIMHHPLQSRYNRFDLEYKGAVASTAAERRYQNDFELLAGSGTSYRRIRFNRQFEDNNKTADNQLSGTYDINFLLSKLFRLLHIDMMRPPSLSFTNVLHHRYQAATAVVTDFDTTTGKYSTLNGYLTNSNRQHYLEERPGLSLSRSWNKNLANRYSKDLNITGRVAGQYQLLHNRSDKAFRTLSNGYFAVLPSANISYTYNRTMAFKRNLMAVYNTATRIPSIDELAPLVDSTNLLYIRLGNPNLKMEYTHTLTFGYSANNVKDGRSFTAELTGKSYRNRIILNPFIDAQGRQTVYPVNTNNYKTVEGHVNYSRSFRIKNATLAINGSGNTRYESGILFINNKKGTFQNQVQYVYVAANAYFGNTQLQLSQSGNLYYNRSETDVGYTANGLNYTAGIMLERRFPFKLTVATNANVTYFDASQIEAITRTIWNVTLSYRLLKGEQLECRLSLNDMLKQNQTVLNTAFQNKISRTEVNRLTQFALFSISYYPRQFGSTPK